MKVKTALESEPHYLISFHRKSAVAANFLRAAEVYIHPLKPLYSQPQAICELRTGRERVSFLLLSNITKQTIRMDSSFFGYYTKHLFPHSSEFQIMIVFCTVIRRLHNSRHFLPKGRIYFLSLYCISKFHL